MDVKVLPVATPLKFKSFNEISALEIYLHNQESVITVVVISGKILPLKGVNECLTENASKAKLNSCKWENPHKH